MPVLIVSFFLSFPFFSFLSFLSPHPGRKTNHRPTILDHTDKSTPVNFSFRAFPRQKFESNRYIRTSDDKFQASLRKGRKRERGRRIVGIERKSREKRKSGGRERSSLGEIPHGDKVFPLEAAPLLPTGRADRQTKRLEKRWSKNHPNRRCMDPCARLRHRSAPEGRGSARRGIGRAVGRAQ